MDKPRKPTAEVIREQASEIRQWQPPHVRNLDELPVDSPPQMLTAAQLGEIQKAAHAEGFEQGRREGQEFGHREGVEQGRAAVADRVRRLDELLDALDKPFERLDQQVEQEIVTLVISMVRQLLRREVKLDPGQVVGVVREALGILPVGARNIRVVLHPEDAELVREAYTLGEHDQKWQIIEDPVIQRGGCRIHTDTSQVDATLDSRLNSLIAPLLAGERYQDSSESGGA
jgi:flagellar assembly protein FliH